MLREGRKDSEQLSRHQINFTFFFFPKIIPMDLAFSSVL